MPKVTGLLLPLLYGIAVFLAFWVVAKLVRDFLARVLQRRGVRSETVLLMTRIVYVAIIALGGFEFVGFALKSENIAISGFLAAAIVASLGIQDILRNYVSGFYLLLERHVRVGDVIEHGGKTGVVTEVRMRVTFLREEGGAVVMIPNALLFNDAVVIHSTQEPREGAQAAEPGPKRGPRGLFGRKPRTEGPPGQSPP